MTELLFPLKCEGETPPAIKSWAECMTRAIKQAGYAQKDTESMMKEAGFVNVKKQIFEMPTNRGHKRWGKNAELKNIGRGVKRDFTRIY